jgi:prepilin-type N-terminal cleavage/methylation domain-containing protein/prepilin-type processing-associated H-X9-DG protein
MSRRLRQRGFTLVELLVVIAIIGTLVALLLPAVQGARESARKMSCSNNLHNLVFALQQYHDSMGSFPSGYICRFDPSGSVIANSEGWGWGSLLLPFLEQKTLHTPLEVTSRRLEEKLASASIDPNVRTLITTPLKIFMCPSDTGYQGRGQVDSTRTFNAAGLGTSAGGIAPTAAGVSNYIGVGGHRRVASATANTGIFFGNSYIRMADILDGTSTTAIVGERDTLVCHSGTWVGIQNPTGTGSRGFSMLIGYAQPRLNAPPDPVTGSTQFAQGCGEGFSSLHPGGAQFAFADGSVRFITTGINYFYVNTTTGAGAGANDHKDRRNGVYQRMLSRNDRIPIGDL